MTNAMASDVDTGNEKTASSEGEGFSVFSWNVNGIRTVNFPELLATMNGDIVGIQETKISRDQINQSFAMVDGYSSYFTFSKNRSGYSGVATFCKDSCAPDDAEEGLCGTINELEDELAVQISSLDKSSSRYADADGRAVITRHLIQDENDIENYLAVINVYCPRWRSDPKDGPVNDDFKLFFHHVLEKRATHYIKKGYFVLIIGDLNICHKFIDQAEVTDIKSFIQTPFRNWMDELLEESNPNFMKDTFRMLNPDARDAFTCWCTRTNARQNNFGSRIDYVLADNRLSKYLTDARIHSDILGSDHCPVSATFSKLRLLRSEKIPALCSKNYAEFYKNRKLTHFISRNHKTQNNCQDAEKLKNKEHISSHVKGDKEGSKCRKPAQSTLDTFFGKKRKYDEINLEEETGNSSVAVTSNFKSYKQETGLFQRLNSSASKEWKQMFQKQESPLCKGHQESCTLRTVRKKGPNQGRQFWGCSRGAGNKNDPNASCDFFQWAKAASK